jgi:GTP cyclohydrolase II
MDEGVGLEYNYYMVYEASNNEIEISKLREKYSVASILKQMLDSTGIKLHKINPADYKLSSIELIAITPFPTNYGTEALGMVFKAKRIGSDKYNFIHAAARNMKNLSENDYKAIVRMQSGCINAEIHHFVECDCSAQLVAAQKMIYAEENHAPSLIIYYPSEVDEGRGQGHEIKYRGLMAEHFMNEFAKLPKEFTTVDAYKFLGVEFDIRDPRESAAILAMLGIKSVDLITGNPKKVKMLRNYLVDVKVRAIDIPIGDISQRAKAYRLVKKKLGYDYKDEL